MNRLLGNLVSYALIAARVTNAKPVQSVVFNWAPGRGIYPGCRCVRVFNWESTAPFPAIAKGIHEFMEVKRKP